MKSKPIVPRESASQDVEDAVDYYLKEAGEQIALGFVESLEQAYRHRPTCQRVTALCP